MRGKDYLRYYVGVSRTKWDVIRIYEKEIPLFEKAKTYFALIGPFRTKIGAEIMAFHGGGNPHLQCVSDAERIAKRGRAQLRKEGFRV
jgi:hypothetical protein